MGLDDALRAKKEKEESDKKNREEVLKKMQSETLLFKSEAENAMEQSILPKVKELLQVFTNNEYSAQFGQQKPITYLDRKTLSFTVSKGHKTMQVDIVVDTISKTIQVKFPLSSLRPNADKALQLNDTLTDELEKLVTDEALRDL
jgi:hypothetical protein